MTELIKTNTEYIEWITEISENFRRCQIKASVKVNDEMLRFFWHLGKDLKNKKDEYAWGSHFYYQVSKDLSEKFPNIKSFSQRNLQYMTQFYQLFPNAINAHQVGAQLNEDIVFLIPWGHIKVILDKCRNNRDKALFYVRKTIENYWSRAVLLNFLDTDLFERQGNAINNFAITLPSNKSDLAQAITKDPYNFDFLTISEKYNEKELKDALMDNIEKFLLELGNGFAFVGREVRLAIGETEEYVDMLFYNIKLHCYVVVEVKIEEFDVRDMGQLGTYMVTINHNLKGKNDEPTLGLIICKSKDNIKAQYALESSSQPMGISSYDINTFLPENYKISLPSVKDIETELSK